MNRRLGIRDFLRAKSARRRFPRQPPPLSPRSYPLSHPCREDAKLVAVFGDRASGNLDAALAKNVHDCLISERMPRIFFLYELLELRLDPARGYIVAI